MLCCRYLLKYPVWDLEINEDNEKEKPDGSFFSCMQHTVTLLCCCLHNSKFLTTAQRDLPLTIKNSINDFLQSCCHSVALPLHEFVTKSIKLVFISGVRDRLFIFVLFLN